MATNETQSAAILAHLKRGKTITSLEALRLYGCLRLSGRIYDLRKDKHPIEKTMVEVESGKRVARYRLPRKRKAA